MNESICFKLFFFLSLKQLNYLFIWYFVVSYKFNSKLSTNKVILVVQDSNKYSLTLRNGS